MQITDDPFDDNLQTPGMNTENPVSWWQMRKYYMSAIYGRGEYLCRTENIVHTLGKSCLQNVELENS